MTSRVCALAMATALAGGLGLALPPTSAEAAGTSCKLSRDGNIKHIFYLQFDNVHFTRDNPNVPSDLEQMPHLLNFMESNGSLLTNHHTPLISHTSVDIITSLTGVYPDSFGTPVGNSFGYYNPDGTVSFISTFTYWTDKMPNGQPEMQAKNGKNAPAPWVAFTRAGCNVGAYSIANMELENVTSDLTTVFGAGSPQEAEGKSNPSQAAIDFEGVAIHCAFNAALCANGQNDLLPDEPNGYNGYMALFGDVNVAPAITTTGAVKDLDGNVIHGAFGFSPTASQGLGYTAQMLENGVDVIFTYLADAHDNRSGPGTFGPGEQGYHQQLLAYDAAFDKFFQRLAADGITKDNTLFIFTADENDHFVGVQKQGCDGVTVFCTYTNSEKGEINADLSKVIFTESHDAVPFSVHSDDVPEVYITANPTPRESSTRRLEKAFGAATGVNPYTGATDQLIQRIADVDEMRILHMIPHDHSRIPTFIPFADANYFLSASTSKTACSPLASCFTIGSNFAWDHGDFQSDIVTTWLGMVGPGIKTVGQTDAIWSDHTDIRPTILGVTGLHDDYHHDGRMLYEIVDNKHLPGVIAAQPTVFGQVATALKTIAAPVNTLGLNTLNYATQGILSDNTTYANVDATLKSIAQQRDALELQMILAIEGATFKAQAIDPATAQSYANQAQALINSVPAHP